jgi:hypothetical protein
MIGVQLRSKFLSFGYDQGINLKRVISWYQTLPGPNLGILPVEQRLPRRPEEPLPRDQPSRNTAGLSDLQKKMIKQRQERLDEFVADKLAVLERRAADSRDRAKKNTEHAAEVRKRFLASLQRE